jgi:hypothetical protein
MELSRRRVLGGVAAAGSVALAGCSLFDDAQDIQGSVGENGVEGVTVVGVSQSFTATPQGRALAMTARLRNDREEAIPGGTVCATFRLLDAEGSRLGAVAVELQREFPPGDVLPLSGAYTENPDAVARYELTLSTC